jgi:hypothetical protein
MTGLAALHHRRARGGKYRSAPFRAGAAAVALGICAAVVMAAAGSSPPAAAFAAFVAIAGVASGHLLRRNDDAAAKAARMLMLRAADELVQYRAFTRLLRDQGGRIVECTSEAAMGIIAGLTRMDAALERMRVLTERGAAADTGEMRSLVDAIGAPVVEMLGQLQFQDITQQQIALLSRLSLVLDEHTVELARLLGERRTRERPERFRKVFEEALDHCVMDGQRDDHHAASGLAQREDAGRKLELF